MTAIVNAEWTPPLGESFRSKTMRVLLLLVILMTCSCTKDQAGDPLDDAKRFSNEGKFERALQKHIWLHDHVLEDRPGYRGVRLSFALAEWVELGKKYPKALEALKDIRNKKTTRLLDGERQRDLFNDVESINDYLGESKATVELFKKIEAAQPEFATSIYDLADEALVEAGEFALAKKYLGDPAARLSTAQRNFERGIQHSKTSPMGEASQRAFEGIFTDEILRIIAVLNNTGARDQARQIQSAALNVLDNPAIRGAIKD